jgi:ribonucleoside-diphosphate reductase alpha chain
MPVQTKTSEQLSSNKLGFKRYFTSDAKPTAYDHFTWVKRDSLLTNYFTKEVVFEQKGVEFPDFWSVNAVNIVSQKYFCGTPGTAGREGSLKTLINRVADTVSAHGLKEGYFSDAQEAEIFTQELKFILASQRAAFNSPVWFNIGAEDRAQQASACFILSVEDTMPSILNWYTEEGMIFKGGSGAGLNLSKLRSSVEPLGNSGGTASGPLSFMRGADSSAGAIKSGGKTRRAAKMVIMNVDHPDVEEFIWCKAVEERKARVLQAAGFDMSLDGKDIHSVQYQNANNSVRVTDDFMKAVLEDKDWDLKAVKTGKTIKTLRARDLFRQFAEAAWECADPGMQFDTTINNWHTTPNAGRINASNPCSEYMHLDDSACNLASLNLLRFLDDNGRFDVAAFRHTTRVIFTAQDILVGYSVYPTESITKNAKAYRELGIGYANLGAMLMAQGLAYDSDAGRAQAAAITALLTGESYLASAHMAKKVGPFSGFVRDQEGMIRVLKMHKDSLSRIDNQYVAEDLLSAAHEAWDGAVTFGSTYGVRNSQASVLAPTGTIGFMMDCDTTGIEPDLGLVKTKKLVGGGTMSIVNQTIPRALKTMGYNPEQLSAITDYIDVEKSIVGAPALKPEHLSVFACSMGDNTIHYLGHVKMMAAVQPFLSGAISKTINMPESATVEDVERMHIDSWQMGLKAVAIYRDNCKVGQPLSMTKKDDAKEDSANSTNPGATLGQGLTDVASASSQLPGAAPGQVAEQASAGFVLKGAMKRKLPKVRNSKTCEFRVSDLKGFFTVGEYADGTPGELFVNVAKQGSTLSGLMDSFAITVSHGLQYGVPLKSYVKALMGTSFAPSGMTDDADITMASSVTDYIFRRLALNYLSFDDRLELGLANFEDMDMSEQASLIDDIESLPVDAKPASSVHPVVAVSQESAAQPAQLLPIPEISTKKKSVQDIDAPICFSCGNQTQRAGSCYVCTSCGATSGCS